MDFRNGLPRRSAARRLVVLCAAALCLQFNGLAQVAGTASPSTDSAGDARIDVLLKTLGEGRTPTSVAISPDGVYVAWAMNSRDGSELHLTRVAPAGAAKDTSAEKGWPAERVISPDTILDPKNQKAGACTASRPAWSPDGGQLAFLSNCSGSGDGWQTTTQDNIFVWTPASNTVKQVSHLHGEGSSLQWSPDGKLIGFLYVENATRRAGALDAMKPWSGVIGEDGVEVQRVAAVGVGGFGGSQQVVGSQHMFFYLSAPNLHVYEFTWAPSSRRIAFEAAPPPGENNWWIAQLYVHDVIRPWDNDVCPAGQDCSAKSIVDPAAASGSLHGLQIAVPQFSPDGKQIAFIGGLMSDQGATGGDVYVIPASGLPTGGEPKDVTAGRAASPAWNHWLDDNTIGISEHVGGSTHITALDLRTGKDVPSIDLTLPETVFADDDVMSVSTSKTDNIAMIRQSFERGPEVWAGPLNGMKQVTHLNDEAKPAWGKAESIEYTNEGFHLQGWLLYPAAWTPADAANGKAYPLVVSVHGGPSSAVTPRWPGPAFGPVPFSALGYFVFMPNPRGSFGQGERFTQANIKDFGYGDLRDILAGVDAIERRFPIDREREGITGWSYGGFMTMFAVTQTTRFKAAVAGAGLSNWQSYYGENSIDQWMTPFFGATVYDDPAVYAKSSPINFIKNVKTPTLMVVGDRDGECPAPQSFEFWHALKAEGVKTQLVVYPNEGHHFVDPGHQRDVLKRALDWFEAEMPAK
jgi:dipeptidyl aminopeptidase/acylaminoacyl peptidase